MQLLTSMIMKNNVINNGINYVINNVIILKVNLVDKSDWRRSGFIKLKEVKMLNRVQVTRKQIPPTLVWSIIRHYFE
jgi:hypothetical protein